MNKIAKYKFNNTVYDLFPTFNEGYTYTYEDIVEDTITTRTITSESIPTDIKFNNNGKLALLEVLELDINGLTSLYETFDGCENVTMIECSKWDTSNIKSLIHCFRNCKSLTTLDVSNWNTDNVTNMQSMFQNCSNLTTLDVSNFNTSNVTLMDYMFQNCSNLTTLDVSNWNTDNVTDMYSMFRDCTNLISLDVSNFNTSNVTDMRLMFRDCRSLTTLDISNFDLNNVSNTNGIFLNVSNNLLTINMKYSDYNSVNKIIEQLPTRKEGNEGTLDISGIDDISQVNIEAANVKYWNVIHNSIVDVKPSLVINPQKPKKNLIIGNYKIMYKNKRIYDNLK